MTVEIKRVPAGTQMIDADGKLTLTGAQIINRMNEAIAELQKPTSPDGTQWTWGVDNAGNFTSSS